MAEERLIFPAQAEGLVRCLGDDLSDSLKRRFVTLDLDVDHELPPAWPARRLGEWIDAIAIELYPKLPRDEAHRLIGRRFVEGWQRTMLGSAMVPLLGIFGPKRTLERLTRAFRTGDNFSQTSVVFPTERSGVVTVRSERLPHYIVGILEAGLSLVRVKGQVRIEEDTEERLVFRVEWE